MKYSLETNFRITRHRLPPSMQVEGLDCSRRLWLMHRNVAVYGVRQYSEKILAFKYHLSNEWKRNWQFEIRLPSGTRINALIPGEEVLIDFKNSQPKAKHLYQAWMIIEELEVLAVTGAEFQLWYPKKWKKEVFKLAEMMKLEAAENPAGCAVVAVDRPDTDFLKRRGHDTAIMLADLEEAKPPRQKSIDSEPCRDCKFVEFCHI